MKPYHFAILLVLFTAAGCQQESNYYDGEGRKPVYLPYAELKNVLNIAPQPVRNSGPVFLKDTLLFMVEQRSGIHVFNISDTANPVQLTFFKIPAVNDFTISGTTLYADNGPNLLSIDISNLLYIRVTSTTENVLQPILFPQLYRGYFECVDESKGVVIDWVDTLITDAKCQTI